MGLLGSRQVVEAVRSAIGTSMVAVEAVEAVEVS
jgi:hypothetical protein